MNFPSHVDARLRRAVQQESRNLSSSLKRRRRRAGIPGCLLLIVLTPTFLLAVLIYFLSIYSAEIDQQRKANALLRATDRDQTMRSHINELEAQLALKQTIDIAPNDNAHPIVLVLSTEFGEIRITLLPSLSEGSVDYLRQLVESQVCRRCNFYRAEQDGILQGVMENSDIPTNTVLGACPKGAETIPNECPEWDKKCGCHGPLMTRGSVAWAAGQAGGPDFFIDAYKTPATWWGTQHTNFGFIDDVRSMNVVDLILQRPVQLHQGLHQLVQPIHFDLSLQF